MSGPNLTPPTVGRIVLFRSTNPVHMGNGAGQVPAIVTRVWSDNCVNLTVFGDAIEPRFFTSISYDDSDSLPRPVGEEAFAHAAWRWMPYQVAQHAKHSAEEVASDPEKINPALTESVEPAGLAGLAEARNRDYHREVALSHAIQFLRESPAKVPDVVAAAGEFYAFLMDDTAT